MKDEETGKRKNQEKRGCSEDGKQTEDPKTGWNF